jgi:spore coat protein H
VAPDASAGLPDRGSGPPPALDARPSPDLVPPTSVPAVFDTKVLHRIEITVASEHLPQLDADQENRVPCTVVFDGVTLPQSGIRKKGGRGSLRPLAEKPGFSIKFNEFVKGQKLAKLSKLLLNNAVMDPSFLNEHIAYELARRWGLAAPLTAHGLVTLNGEPKGLYVVREAINDDFLRRIYGDGNEDGNLYEGVGGVDFAVQPGRVQLKDEVEEARSRADVEELGRLARSTPDSRWLQVVGEKLDVPEAISAMAFEWHVGHWDGYFFQPNNYYLYHHPGRKRFVLIVAGLDAALRSDLGTRTGRTLVSRKFEVLPESAAQYQAKRTQFLADLNVEDVHARMDAAAAVIRSHTPADPQTKQDYASFERSFARKKATIVTLKTTGKIVP